MTLIGNEDENDFGKWLRLKESGEIAYLRRKYPILSVENCIDIYSESMIKMLEAGRRRLFERKTLVSPGAEKYLRSVTYTCAVDWYRKNKPDLFIQPPSVFDDDDARTWEDMLVDPSPDTLTQLIGGEDLAEHLENCLSKRPRYLEIVKLFLQGYPNDKIANILNISKRAVELYKCYAMKMLREYFKAGGR